MNNDFDTPDSDCGLKSDGRDISGGAAFGLAIVAFVLAIVQAICFVMAGKDNTAA